MSPEDNTEPVALRQGDGASWRRSLPMYPASAGWALHYRLLFAIPPAVTWDATADGDDHLVTLSSTQTAAMQSGSGTLVAWVTKGSERATILQQAITVSPDLTSATSLDSRSAAVRRLADAEAALSAYLAAGKAHVASYKIDGREMVFRGASELQAIVDAARRDVIAERHRMAAAHGLTPGRVFTRF